MITIGMIVLVGWIPVVLGFFSNNGFFIAIFIMEEMMADDKDVVARVQQANAYLDKAYNLNGQLDWYDKKAKYNKAWHMWLGLIIIVAGAATSIVQLWSPTPQGVHWSTWLSAILGAVVIIAKGVDSLWKFDENWLNYRQAAEQLKRERRFYINLTGPYQACRDQGAAFQMFVERIEGIIAAEENIFWKDKSPVSAPST